MKIFMDTNVVVYANDTDSPRKQVLAIDRIKTFVGDGNGVVSSQVFQEFAAIAAGKLKMSMELMFRQIAALERLEVVLISPALVRRSLELRDRYGVHFWDACILAAAEHANCAVVLSEDLNAGQYYGSVCVENPFVV